MSEVTEIRCCKHWMQGKLARVDDECPWCEIERLQKSLAAEKYAADNYRRLLDEADHRREHITTGEPCWCNPETTYIDTDTGLEVIVHKEQQ